MHFLQPEKYDLLEQDFDLTDEDKEAKIRDLHDQLKDIMLRRLKRDVVKSLPTKSERILRVEMSQMQLWWYKNILAKVSSIISGQANSSTRKFLTASPNRTIQFSLPMIPKSRCLISLWSSRRLQIILIFSMGLRCVLRIETLL